MTDWSSQPPDARVAYERASELASQGEYEGASALYARAVGNPDPELHVAALLGLADSRYRLDDDEGALQAWLTAAQAPETPLAWQAWVALAGARVRQGDLVAAARAYREAERRAPPQERAAIAGRLGWLNKELGQEGTAQRYFGRARAGGAFTPMVTYLILGLTVGIGVATMISPVSAEFFFGLFALDKQAVAAGEYWRLLTVTLVHGGLMHLLFNMYALFIVGPIVEALYGRALFLLFYLLSAAVGSVASYLFVPAPSVGASGAVFGLFGILFISTWRHKPALGRQARALTGQIGILIAFNLALGFGLGGAFGVRIDNAAHVGGLLSGAWLGFALVPRGLATLSSFWQRPQQAGTADGQGQEPQALLRVAAVLVVVIVVGVGLSLTPLWA
ncbi:MAG TPA: rhomboid family intramembrane serine protease [Candidatus Limnocylindria bacterium]|nr:rhomboid family intramembrane serine protease [Candidatus Limnocylindria bacterium]